MARTASHPYVTVQSRPTEYQNATPLCPHQMIMTVRVVMASQVRNTQKSSWVNDRVRHLDE